MTNLLNLGRLGSIGDTSNFLVFLSIQKILGEDLLGFFDADNKESITLVDGKVSTWKDIVSGNVLSQTTSANRPTYSESDFNNRASVSTDGIQQFMTATTTNNYPTGSSPSEIWILGSQNAAINTPTQSIFAYGAGNAGQSRLLRKVGGSNPVRLSVTGGSSGANVSILGQNVNASGRLIARAAFEPEFFSLEVNGAVEGQVEANLSGTATTRTRLGSNLAGTAAEFSAFSFNKILICKPLSSEKSIVLRTYLSLIGAVQLVEQYSETIDLKKWRIIKEDPFVTPTGINYHNDSGLYDWSVATSLSHSNYYRFEVREGDMWEGDDYRVPIPNRAELGSYIGYHPYGQVEWYSFSFKVRNVGAAGNRNIVQLFNEDVEFQLKSLPSATTISTMHNPGTGRITTERYSGPSLVENVPENWVIRALRIPTNGSLSVWRNGTQILNLTNIDFGTSNPQKKHKLGIYRPATRTTSVVEIANFRFDGDLSSKITAPDPWPSI